MQSLLHSCVLSYITPSETIIIVYSGPQGNRPIYIGSCGQTIFAHAGRYRMIRDYKRPRREKGSGRLRKICSVVIQQPVGTDCNWTIIFIIYLSILGLQTAVAKTDGPRGQLANAPIKLNIYIKPY